MSLTELKTNIVVLTGHNKKLKARCEGLSDKARIRVLGWTEKVAALMQSADILISKLGLTFYEAMVCGLPIIALEPPPGAERIQYNLLETFGTRRAVKTILEMKKAFGKLLGNKDLLNRMRKQTESIGQAQAAEKLALWIREAIEKSDE